jgi:UDP-3-O-[3-hydroxymyristoyl] glucosamine N-acyltransferase
VLFSNLKEFDSSIELFSSKDQDPDVLGLTNIEFPRDGHLIFIKDKKFLNKFLEAKDTWIDFKFGVLITKDLWDKSGEETGLVDDVEFIATSKSIDLSISFLSKPFYDEKFSELNNMVDGRQMGTAEVHPTAHIAQTAFIGEGVIIGTNVKIHAGAVIMAKAEIGDNTVIYPNATIYEFVKLGKNCRIHSQATIGADGYGYNFDAGVHHKVWHMGSVIIGDDVEIGANSAVDQGTFSPTTIGSGTKIDNHVQIGHNCQIGVGVIMCGNSGVAGSSTVGDYCVFGGKAAFGNGLTLGKGSQLAGSAMVTSSWPEGSVLGGHPARPVKEWLKGVAFVRKESLKK